VAGLVVPLGLAPSAGEVADVESAAELLGRRFAESAFKNSPLFKLRCEVAAETGLAETPERLVAVVAPIAALGPAVANTDLDDASVVLVRVCLDVDTADVLPGVDPADADAVAGVETLTLSYDRSWD
jgi:hypothetical protein